MYVYYYFFFVVCVEMNVFVCLQVGYIGLFMFLEVGRFILYIDQIVIDFLDFKIVCGYIGYFWMIEMIVVVIKYIYVYIDILVYIVRWYF